MRITTNHSEGHHYITPSNIILAGSPDEMQGMGDSLGRTAIGALIYNENREQLINGVNRYFIRATEQHRERIYMIRCPGIALRYEVTGNSRDHLVKALSVWKQLGYHDKVKDYLEHRPKRPCIEHPFTPGQFLYFKALYSKPWSWAYFLFKLPGTGLIPLYNWILRAISGTLRTYKNPTEWYTATRTRPPTKYQRAIYRAIIPTFSSFYTMFEIEAIEAETPKRILKYLMRLQFEKHNYVGQALCGNNERLWNYYAPSRINRWSIRLDRTCNRWARPHPGDTAENNIEMGMLQYFRNQDPLGGIINH